MIRLLQSCKFAASCLSWRPCANAQTPKSLLSNLCSTSCWCNSFQSLVWKHPAVLDVVLPKPIVISHWLLAPVRWLGLASPRTVGAVWAGPSMVVRAPGYPNIGIFNQTTTNNLITHQLVALIIGCNRWINPKVAELPNPNLVLDCIRMKLISHSQNNNLVS